MITPFGPPHDDLDSLNTILDAQVTGKRAPEPGKASDSDTDALAATARLVSGTPLDAREHASAVTLDSIWRNIMHAHALPDPTESFDARPLAVRSSSRSHGKRSQEATAPSPWLSIAAMVVLLFGIIGSAWTMRSGNGGNDEPIRLAAIAPLGTPESDAQWLTWVTPEECTLDPMRPSEVTALQTGQDVVPVPEYGPVSKPSQADADAAARGARALTACFMYRSDGSYSSEPYLWLYTSPNSPLAAPKAAIKHKESNGRNVSQDLKDLSPKNLLLTTTIQPDPAQEEMPVTYLPDQAIQFPDGRIGIPMAYLIPEDSAFEAPKALYTTLSVFSDESGAWLLDDALSICVGDCEAYIAGGPWLGNSFLAQSEDSMDWLSWVTPEECTAEPMTTEEYAEIMRTEPDISGRSYEVVGPADPVTADAVAKVAREFNTCTIFGEYRQARTLESDALIFFNSYSSNRTISDAQLHEFDREHGKQISETLPAKEPGDYAVIVDATPPADLMNTQTVTLTPKPFMALAYDPDNAVMLADGRVALPATVLYWSGDESDDWMHIEQWQIDESTQLSTTALILTPDAGSWKVDETGLVICQFEGCSAYWAADALATPAATPDR